MKSTKAEIEKRITDIYQLLIRAYTYTDIVRYCAENYGIKARNVDKYIKKATQKITLENNKTLDELRAEANIRYSSWIRKAEAKEDYKTAAYLQSRKDKINGLEVQKIEHSGEIKSDLSPMFEIVKNLIEESKNSKSNK